MVQPHHDSPKLHHGLIKGGGQDLKHPALEVAKPSARCMFEVAIDVVDARGNIILSWKGTDSATRAATSANHVAANTHLVLRYTKDNSISVIGRVPVVAWPLRECLQQDPCPPTMLILRYLIDASSCIPPPPTAPAGQVQQHVQGRQEAAFCMHAVSLDYVSGDPIKSYIFEHPPAVEGNRGRLHGASPI
jgi:hypothetical protein